jgi:hypothetical protein
MTKRSWILGVAVAECLLCLPWLPAEAGITVKYNRRTRAIPVDSKADLESRRNHFGREVRFSTAASLLTPGFPAGYTYYDYQHNSSTGRQVDQDNGKVQTSWMSAPGPSASVRTVLWNRRNVLGSPSDFTLANGEVIRRLEIYGNQLFNGDDIGTGRSGFTNFRNRPGGKGVEVHHIAPESNGIKYWESRLDLSPGNGVFAGTPSVAPRVPIDFVEDAPIWPKQAISTCGTDLVQHAVATWSGGSEQVFYYRGLINDSTGMVSWSSMPLGLPVMIDPVSSGISAVIEASGDKVVIAMAKQINPTNADLVYYQSTDCGTTWGAMVNVTQFSDQDPQGLWSELGAVFDEEGEIHIIFNTTPPSGSMYPTNLYHWSQSTGVRLITSASWEPYCTPCSACSPVFTISDLALAEPNLSVKPAGVHGIPEELIIAVWTQYGPGGTDCARPSGVYYNGEIYLSVSSDHGLTWDRPQNVTGTNTPGCLAGDCYSESWVSAAARADSGIYLSYVEDKDAGAAVRGEGAWTENPYMVLAVEARLPIPAPVIAVWPTNFVELHANPILATPESETVTIHNTGTASLNFAVSVAPDNGGPTHVDVNGSTSYAGTIAPAGPPDVIQVHYQTFGLLDPSEHHWRLEITSNDPVNDPGQGGSPIDVQLQVFAASEWNACEADTLSTGLHRMQVSSCLEMGDNGQLATGFFNMSDSSEWIISGSPVVTLVRSGDTLTYFNAHMTASNRTRAINRSFRAQSPMTVVRDTTVVIGATSFLADVAKGSASTTDTLIGFDYEVVFPKSAQLRRGAYWSIQMYNLAGLGLTGITYGALAHLAAPPNSDVLGVGSDPKGWIGIVGGELLDSGVFVHNNNRVALFQIDSETPCYRGKGSAAQVLDNAFYLAPYGGYHPDSLHSLFTTFGAMGTWGTGFHVDTGQVAADASVMLVEDHAVDLAVGDTIRWTYGIAVSDVSEADLVATIDSIRLASDPLATECCPIYLVGDVNSSAAVTSADIIYLVNYIFKGGPCPLPCCANGNVNCDGVVSSADVIRLVNYVFKSGVAPCDICHDSPMACEP